MPCPIARQPSLVGRCLSPHAADPYKIFSLFIPKPISRNPDNVFSSWLDLRRNLSHRRWWFTIDYQAVYRFVGVWLGKSLMHRTIPQDFA
jgi:hypothetical protein